LETSSAQKNQELAELKAKAEQFEKHLQAAAELINGLGDTRLRWQQEKSQIAGTKVRLVGDCLLAAAFLSYTGAFTYDYRKRMVYDDWYKDIVQRKIPITENLKVESLLATDVEVSRWVYEGLPGDELSVQNGILTTRASRFPLLIDPQQQAIKWIKSRESNAMQAQMAMGLAAARERRREQTKQQESKAASTDTNDEFVERERLQVRSFNDSDYLKILEHAINFGYPFLFENVGEELDPLIDPVLERNFVMNGGQKAVIIGDTPVDWNDNFRMYLVTKLSNPRFSPEVAAKTMIINFTVTMQGLEDQLLNVLLKHEREDLQNQREDLIQTISRNTITKVELEDAMLKELQNAEGNILDNEKLISTLKDIKTKTAAITEQLAESKAAAEEMEKMTEIYRPAAKRGAVLFFSMYVI